MKIRLVLLTFFVSLALLPLRAQINDWHGHDDESQEHHNENAYYSSDVGAPKTLHLRSNLLYDAVLMPNLGIELGLGGRWTFLAEGTFNWLSREKKHDYWRMGCGSVEARYWLGGSVSAMLHRGHHFGVYAAGYRYDFEFGDKGEMGDFNYGGGISYGYSARIGRKFSLDFGLAVGYIGGKYKEYKPVDTHYVWQADKTRAWFGPTKVEIALVWTIELKKKGGQEW